MDNDNTMKGDSYFVAKEFFADPQKMALLS